MSDQIESSDSVKSAVLAGDACSGELETAYANLVKAAEEYGRLAPKRPAPTEPPSIMPTLLHAAPSNFHLGYNMMLDAGGYMPGKIPVIVVPARPQDIRRYKRLGTLGKFLRHLGLK